MNIIDLIAIGVLTDAAPIEQSPQTIFPRMYALSKKGAIRVYEIIVEDMGDHAVMTTRKKVTLNGKWTEDSYEFWEGVNIGKSNETTYLEQAIFRAESAISRLRDAGFTENMPKSGQQFNTDANGKIKPMLACGFSAKKIKFPCIAQPKYDGVRCTVSINSNNEIDIISRKGKKYNIPHLTKWAEEHRDLLPLDGELYNHKELTFQEIISAVKKESDITSMIRYVVYDKPIADVPNDERWQMLVDSEISPMTDRNKGSNNPIVYRSDYQICNNMKQLDKLHDMWVADGYEGAIIRNTDGLYEFGFRSNNLIKLKKFKDSEYQIADVLEATGRDAGTAIFLCYLNGHEGEEITEDNSFRVKPQGTREQRAEYFENAEDIIGKMCTVKYQELTDDGKPRFPSAIAIRDYE